MAVVSMEKGNVPFNEATLVGMIMATCPIVWRNQYNLMHKTVPESPRTMLPSLEKIEKFFFKKYNDKANANKARATAAPKASEVCVPRKRRLEGLFCQILLLVQG